MRVNAAEVPWVQWRVNRGWVREGTCAGRALG